MKFNREKYNLIFFAAQTFQDTDIHEICGGCSNILNWFSNRDWYFRNPQHHKEIDSQYYSEERFNSDIVRRLNQAIKKNYSFSDFVGD